MPGSNLSAFGDFFEKDVLPEIIQNKIVKVNSLGYFFIHRARPLEGRDPKTNETVNLPAKNELFFKEELPDDFVRNIGINNIPLINKNFSGIEGLKQTIKAENDVHRAALISTSYGKKLLKMHPGLSDHLFSGDDTSKVLKGDQERELLAFPLKYLAEQIATKDATLILEKQTTRDGEIVIGLQKE